MRSPAKCIFFSVTIVIACFLSASAAAAVEQQTLTGTVSDSMCGQQHMEADAAKCTRACVGHGAKYTLVVGDKVYSLNTSDKALRAKLDEQAGSKATVTGNVNGIAVEVASVTAAK